MTDELVRLLLAGEPRCPACGEAGLLERIPYEGETFLFCYACGSLGEGSRVEGRGSTGPNRPTPSTLDPRPSILDPSQAACPQCGTSLPLEGAAVDALADYGWSLECPGCEAALSARELSVSAAEEAAAAEALDTRSVKERHDGVQRRRAARAGQVEPRAPTTRIPSNWGFDEEED